jgi:hypothetical protein
VGGGRSVRASRVAAIHGAVAQGWGESIEAGADDNQRIMTSKSFLPKKPVIMQLSAGPSDSSFAASGNRGKLSAADVSIGRNRIFTRSCAESKRRQTFVSRPNQL